MNSALLLKMQSLFFLSVISIFLGCSESSIGEGPGSVETQNSIAGVFFYAENTPARLIPIQVVSAQSVNNIVRLDTTDEQGAFNIHNMPKGLFNVIAKDSVGKIARLLVESAETHNTFETPSAVLNTPIQKTIIIDMSQDLASFSKTWRLRIYGDTTSYTLNKGTGSVAFPAMGTYMLQVENGQFTQDKVIHIDSTLAEVIHISISIEPYFLLDDFEKQCSKNYTNILFGTGDWYITPQNSAVNRNEAVNDFSFACTSDPERGQIVSLSFKEEITDPTYPYSFVVIGTVIGPYDSGVDLTRLDSISFWARGAGETEFNIHTIIRPQNISNQFQSIELANTWTRYSYKMSDFQYKGVSIDYKQSSLLQWLVWSPGFIELDDIRLYGYEASND